MFCPACEEARVHVERLMATPWEYLLAQYEFMIVFATFQRNVLFYSSMDLCQLRNLYCQMVSFSPAMILVTDSLISVYNKGGTGRGLERGSCLDVPCELSRAVTLAVGNCVPEQFIDKCISSCNWKGYDAMVLAAFASVETVRGGVLKYMAIVKESVRNVTSLHAIVALAVTGWMMKLSDSECTCCTWPQAVELVSCSVHDTESTLAIQDEARIGAYIYTLLDISPPENRTAPRERGRTLDYGYMFSDLLVAGLHWTENVNTHH